MRGLVLEARAPDHEFAFGACQPNSMLFVLSPVPEPETYAMLLAGLDLMGLIARRRKIPS
jgi:hypothetical protein